MATVASPHRKEERKHLHVRLTSEDSDIYDIITQYLENAGRSPDTYWRSVGRLEEDDSDTMFDLLSSAFEAGVFISRERPDLVRTLWVTQKECEAERKEGGEGSGDEQSRMREKSALSHYA